MRSPKFNMTISQLERYIFTYFFENRKEKLSYFIGDGSERDNVFY